MVTNALSVDVEEYYHAGTFRQGVGRVAAFTSRVEASSDRLLTLFRQHNAKATFFVLGEVAAEHPAMVRRIASEGHELACHGQHHDDVYLKGPDEFRADIREAKARIEDACGAEVIGYRAPNFSIGRAQAWAYQILLEEGFRYDSSTYPILHDRYGSAGGPRFPFEIWHSGRETLLEFPVGTARLMGVNLPIGGGDSFRLSPFPFVHFGIRRVNTQEHRPVMFYLQPWELDPGLRRPSMSWTQRVRLYVGVRRHRDKIDRLLSCVRFDTARAVLEASVPFPALLAPARPLLRRTA
jgi:polysaccharide deacetylase family protein (PEP-CTERM system associated)